MTLHYAKINRNICKISLLCQPDCGGINRSRLGQLFVHEKAFFPERPTREIYISVAYPGASPKEMEEGITMRIEEAIRGLPGIKEMNSTSSENFCRVAVETTGQYAIDEMLQEIKNAVDGITSLPVDAERPIVYKQRSTTPAIRLGLSGSADLMTLKQLAYQIEDDFLASGYISQINMGVSPPPRFLLRSLKRTCSAIT